MNREERNPIIFYEVQRPRQWWLWVLLLSVAAIFWYIFVKQIFFGIQVGDKPVSDVGVVIIWFIFGVAFPVSILCFVKLVIKIRKDGIYIRFVPFHISDRKFLFKDLKKYEKIPYNAFDFGGWGIRLNLDGEIAYNINGKLGFKLNLDNQTVIIGTQKPDEFKQALKSITKKT